MLLWWINSSNAPWMTNKNLHSPNNQLNHAEILTKTDNSKRKWMSHSLNSSAHLLTYNFNGYSKAIRLVRDCRIKHNGFFDKRSFISHHLPMLHLHISTGVATIYLYLCEIFIDVIKIFITRTQCHCWNQISSRRNNFWSLELVAEGLMRRK